MNKSQCCNADIKIDWEHNLGLPMCDKCGRDYRWKDTMSERDRDWDGDPSDPNNSGNGLYSV